jgi:hypothetical protein
MMEVAMKKGFYSLLFMLAYLFIAISVSRADDEAIKLPGYAADLSKTSISGMSSGAFMSSQFHVAYSDMVVGAGIVAGGPYYCAGLDADTFEIRIQNSVNRCMLPMIDFDAPQGSKLFEKAKEFAKDKKIADLKNLLDDKVYIFSGLNDQVVKSVVVNQVEKFYEAVGVPKNNVKYINTINAGHALVTDDSGSECSANKEPFINDCDLDQAEEILKQIYGQLNQPVKKGELSGKIIKFDQSEFLVGDRHSMSKDAYAYIPKACETSSCKVHVALHGCLQGAAQIGKTYYTETGYNEIADSNNIIVLYPQAQVSKAVPLNPLGCWDYWGYSDTDSDKPKYHTREGAQMEAIAKMIKRLGEPKSQ